jgi:hypothetical protein
MALQGRGEFGGDFESISHCDGIGTIGLRSWKKFPRRSALVMTQHFAVKLGLSLVAYQLTVTRR